MRKPSAIMIADEFIQNTISDVDDESESSEPTITKKKKTTKKLVKSSRNLNRPKLHRILKNLTKNQTKKII
jgi:hypothetical protein